MAKKIIDESGEQHEVRLESTGTCLDCGNGVTVYHTTDRMAFRSCACGHRFHIRLEDRRTLPSFLTGREEARKALADRPYVPLGG